MSSTVAEGPQLRARPCVSQRKPCFLPGTLGPSACASVPGPHLSPRQAGHARCCCRGRSALAQGSACFGEPPRPQGICEHLPWFPWASRPLQPGPPSARWLIHWPPRWPHCVTAVSFRGPGVPRPSCRMGRGLGGATGQGRLGVWGAQGATGPGAGPVHRGRGPSEGPGLPACTGVGAVVRQAGALHPRPRRPRRPRPPLTECCAAVSQAGVPPLPGFPAHCHRPDSRPLGGCPPPAGLGGPGAHEDCMDQHRSEGHRPRERGPRLSTAGPRDLAPA